MKILKIFPPKYFIILFSFILVSCSVYDNHYYHQNLGTFNPNPGNGYFGKIAYEPGANYISFMRDKCAPYGGLILNSIQNSSTKKIGSHLGYLKEYRCTGVVKFDNKNMANTQSEETQKLLSSSQQVQNISPPTGNERLTFEASKNKCSELGFTPATERFGKCVLQLSNNWIFAS